MRKQLQTGFSLIAAIFLIVVVAALGTFMVTIGTTQQQTSLFSVLGTRALFAADSGMQWAIHFVVTNNACLIPPNDSFTLVGGAAAGYDIKLGCAVTNVDEGPDNYNVFQLSATGSRGGVFGAQDFVSRTIRASVTTAP
ncbi:MAG: hypothetical protein ACE5GZ_05160 [Gammaproteobacteria bacterium]